ncbi:PTS sugar transporter subunit IIA [Oceanobacillus sojae]|uniref:PTS sugar transporter subunit IIA n=1 Tax=Oceanobacillus sojae TaxID=582851 RepID=UPI0009888BB0|nr:PTS sugar transporter subunit IIA [Oceanobacillus sojae]
MVDVILISHGDFCQGLLQSLKMVAGEDFGVKAVSLNEGEAPEEFREKLAESIKENHTDNEQETIILSDIPGGTPFQSAAYLAKQYKISLISGMNLPMLLTLCFEKSHNKSLAELVDKVTSESSLGVQVKLFKEGEKSKREKLSIDKNR